MLRKRLIDYGFGEARFWLDENADDKQVRSDFYTCANRCFGIRKSISKYELIGEVRGAELPEEIAALDPTHVLFYQGDNVAFDSRFTTPDGYWWKVLTTSMFGDDPICTCPQRGVPDASCEIHEHWAQPAELQQDPVPGADTATVLAIRLNMGAGAHPLPGYVNIDRCYPEEPLETAIARAQEENCPVKAHGSVFPIGFYRGVYHADGKAFSDGSVNEIRASHILEHFPQGQVADVLREWIRVLAPGGWLKIAVPDFAWIAREALRDGLTPQEGALLQSYVVGGQVDENDYHKAIFEREGLAGALFSLGLVDIQQWTSEIEDCASLPVSLNLMGRKPREGEAIGPRLEIVDVDLPTPENADPHLRIDGDADVRIDDNLVEMLPSIPVNTVRAVMTTPRLGFVEFATCCEQMTASLGIPVQKSFGVFWDQGLTRAIQSELLHFDPKYILTLDYDTVFDPEDVLRLYSILESRDSIDAVCAVQQRRELGTVLIGVADPETGRPAHQVSLSDFAGETFACDTGHFGLTLIRAACFKALPKPWFCAKPNADGDWGSGRTDADIAFWQAFKAAGFKLHQANRVVAGHLEMVVSWPDRQLRTITQPSGDYHVYGKPPKESNVWR